MTKIEIFIIILLIFFGSCSESKLEYELQKEYEKLAKKVDKKIVVNKIKLLKSESIDFEKLAIVEIQILKKVNKLRREELEAIEEIDSLIKVNIGQKKCLFRNANSEYQKKYLKEIDSDSIQLKNNEERLLQLEAGRLEDEIKILKIYELSSLDSIRSSRNLRVEHIIDINIDGKNFVDTLYYISFNNQKYNFLNRNLFIEN